MKISIFINFIFLLLYKDKFRHFSILFISFILVFTLSSVWIIKDSLQNELLKNLNSSSDIKIQNINKTINVSLLDEIKKINGVKDVNQLIYAKYYFLSEDVYLNIVGVDFFENYEFENLINKLNLKEFLKDDNMIVSYQIKELFKKYKYVDTYNFTLANGGSKNVKIFAVLPKNNNLIANDFIILDINLARKIANINDDFVTNITLNVPNSLEINSVKNRILNLDNSLIVVTKDELKRKYENIFNYKGGIFLILYIFVFLTFLLILYQRYSQINSADKKQIAILKALGYSIKDLIKIKFFENFVIAFCAYILGVIFAYIYIFYFDAFLLKNIFIGFSSLRNDFVVPIYVDLSSLLIIFIFFVVPFLSAVLIPTWRISTVEAYENLR